MKKNEFEDISYQFWKEHADEEASAIFLRAVKHIKKLEKENELLKKQLAALQVITKGMADLAVSNNAWILALLNGMVLIED